MKSAYRGRRDSTIGSVRLLAASVFLISGAIALAQTGTPRSPHDLLRDIASVTDGEWSAIERGEAVAKVLDTETREIAVAGAVLISASMDRLLERYRDIDSLKRSSIVLDVGRFGQPAQAADLARTPLEDYSLDLRECRPSNCRVRLSESDIARFHRDVNWDAADWKQRSADIWRDLLAGYVRRYQASGREALPVFANKQAFLSVPSELSGLVDKTGFVGAYSPELLSYLRDLRPPGPAGAEHVIYWSKEDFGVRPILRISHQIILRLSSPPTLLMATNQIYADHYLDAALTINIAIDATRPGQGQSFYLVAMSRARTRSLSGLLRALVRSTVQGRSRDALRKILISTKTALERPL
jgi:hypothetical protein